MLSLSKTIRSLALFGAVMAMAACGSAPSDDPPASPADAPSTAAGQPSTPTSGVPPVAADLIAAAEAEGTVVVYSSQTTPFLDGLVASFQAAYPKVKMEYLKDSSAGIAERLLSEEAANHHVADVYLAWWDTVSRVVDAGQTASFTPDQASAYDPTLADPAGHWHIVAFNPLVIGYNNQAIASDQAPKKWTDLLDARFAGKVGTYDPRIGGGAYAYYYGMWKLFGNDFVTKLGQNSPFVQDASGALASATASGQVELASIGYTGWSPLLGTAPISLILPEDGVPMMDQMVSVVDDAPHPQAARLFVSWLMSEAGQQAIPNNESAIYAALPSVAPPAGLPALSEIDRVKTDYAEYIAQAEAITNAASQALGLAGV
jgi:iron(III) transport system substrate-binding protein